MPINTVPAVVPAFARVADATTNAVLVSQSPCSVGQVDVTNTTAAVVYLRLFNLNRAPVPATDTPAAIIPVAASSTSIINFGAMAKRFTVGFGYAITAAGTVLDGTALPAAGVLIGGTYN